MRLARRSAVGVARPASPHVPGTVSPARPGRRHDADPADDVLTHRAREADEELALQRAQLSGPRRRLRLEHQLTVAQRQRRAVVGYLGAHELRPAPENGRVREPGRPSPVQRHPGHQPAERLRVAVVGAWTRPPPAPAPSRDRFAPLPVRRALRRAFRRRCTRGTQGLTSDVGPMPCRVRAPNGPARFIPRAGGNRTRRWCDGRFAMHAGRSFPLVITKEGGVIHSIHNLVHRCWRSHGRR
jgi:hypothetical protein